MTRRTTPNLSSADQLETDVLDAVAAESAPAATERTGLARRLPPTGVRRPALYLAVAAAGALVVNVLTGGEPPARADAQLESVSIAQQLGISADSAKAALRSDSVGSLEELVASRSERQAEQTAAAKAQAAADQAERDRRAAEAAAKKAAEEAARKKAADAAAAKKAADAAAAKKAAAKKAAPKAPAAPAPSSGSGSGSFQGYALSKLGGDGGQFSCLENLWGKESGWNPNAQNPSSTAYGIPQFLDSTWASTGIAKTSNGYRQIDAGLIYIDSRYGSPCGAWGHSQSTGWY
jgi:hypothetical protein